MAKITISVSDESYGSITLIVSPSEAFEILHKFQNKYPNAIKSNLSIDEWIARWTKVTKE